MRKLIFATVFAIVLLVPIGLNGCGTRTPTSGNFDLSFIPPDTSIATTQTILTSKTFSVLVTENGIPQNGIDVRVMVYLHNRLPFTNAAGVVQFVDDNGAAVSVPSPAGNAGQGTVITVRTNAQGIAPFNLELPLGATYNIDLSAVVGTDSAEAVVTVSATS